MGDPFLLQLFAEIKVHQSMVHENIVKYYHCFEDDDFVYLVLELCESKVNLLLNGVAIVFRGHIRPPFYSLKQVAFIGCNVDAYGAHQAEETTHGA